MNNKVCIFVFILLISVLLCYRNASDTLTFFESYITYNKINRSLVWTSKNKAAAVKIKTTTTSTKKNISVTSMQVQNFIDYKGGYTTNSHLIRQLDETLSNADKKYTILILGLPKFQTFSARHKINQSECGACDLTNDISKINDLETRAVVFSYMYLFRKRSSMPKKRRSDQYYVWMGMESPPALRELRNMSLTEYDNVFNLTMTYRRDADVYYPKSTASKLLQELQKTGSGNPKVDIDDMIKMKTGVSIWIVSNCDGTEGAKKRILLAQDMVNHGLEVDRMGRCFPENSAPPRGTSTVDLIRKYKFYFAFENSYHCLDYITEKLYKKGFVAGTVPVVWGAEKRDYLAVVPPHSCIFVDDFKSTAELVKYLKYLDKNVTAYREYFKWRTMKPQDMPNYGRQIKFCQLCRILHGINVDNIFNPRYNESYLSIPLFEHPSRPRVVSSLREWLYGPVSKECLKTY
ncbi:unnamed protein product [Clavelina lepadiformis]|uniref:Fucosyltransferase n=1 Tax=Clavelina lepadiformis TaxID=159417 RepID=A0ABP0FYW2_CLALP